MSYAKFTAMQDARSLDLEQAIDRATGTTAAERRAEIGRRIDQRVHDAGLAAIRRPADPSSAPGSAAMPVDRPAEPESAETPVAVANR